MLLDIVNYLNTQLSDFGTVLLGGVSFWIIYFVFTAQRNAQRRRYDARLDLKRRFGMPPTRSGGR